jgi:hypothetical protein
MLRRIRDCGVRLVRSVPRLFWIFLLLLFQVLEVYILWPRTTAGERPRLDEAVAAHTLQSRLLPPFVEALSQRWKTAAQSTLPDLSECRDACQCEDDKHVAKSAVAWAVTQMEHKAGVSTRVIVPWRPDSADAAPQCVFADRIVKGHIIVVDSGQQKVCATSASPHALLPTPNETQISCVVPPRFHVVQPGESLYAIALMHSLSHTM